MPFFLRGKRNQPVASRRKGLDLKKGAAKSDNTEELSSSEAGLSDDEQLESDIESEDAAETGAEKRLRLAKTYLDKVQHQVLEEEENADFLKEAVAHRLKEDFYQEPDVSKIRGFRGHKPPVSCVAVSPDGQFAYSGAIDGSLIKWNLESGKRMNVISGCPPKHCTTPGTSHTKAILAVAVSHDGKFVCTGGKDKKINVWNAHSMEHVKQFAGHKSDIRGLSFASRQLQLYSASADRSVKLWDLQQMGYVETLFGHQEGVEGIDSLSADRAVTCGGRDRTVRVWKIVQESQLVFHAHKGCGSVDCIRLINQDHFVSGADDGSLSIWSLSRKKPVCVHHNAHSSAEPGGVAPWITSLACLTNTDLIASGSMDGLVKLWRCSEDYKALDKLYEIPLEGFVNGLSFVPDGSALVCAVGQEHRLGRWWRNKNAKNSIAVIPLPRNELSNVV